MGRPLTTPSRLTAALLLPLAAAACNCTRVRSLAPEGPVRALAAERLAGGGSAPCAGRLAGSPAPGHPSRPLGRDDAVGIALLRNPDLQATLAGLGVGWAEVLDASRPANPVLSASGLLPIRAASGVLWDLDLVQPLVDLLLLPKRRCLAMVAYHALELQTAHTILELAADADHAWIALVASQQVRNVAALIVEATDASAELARRMKAAGNLDDLRVAREEALHEDARTDLDRAEAEVVEARERLHLLMGLGPGERSWQVVPSLPDLPAPEPPAEALAGRALARRLDLLAESRHRDALCLAFGFVRSTGGWVGAEAGVRAEREPDGSWRVGPTLSTSVPIFDQGQADAARLVSEIRQSERREESIRRAIESDVRRIHGRLLIQRKIVERHREVVIPLRERIVALEQQRTNYMLSGVDRLLEAKRAEFAGYRAYVEAVRDYWALRGDLERAIGERLPTPPISPGTAPAQAPPPAAQPAPPAPPPPSDIHEHVHPR